MLVLPVLIVVFLGVSTVASLFMGNMAASQAAEQGVVAWASGGSPSVVASVVSQTLVQEGYHVTPVTRLSSTDGVKSVSVLIPLNLWDSGRVATVAASRSVSTGAGVAPVPSGGGGSGGGGYVYHHFPMW